ncbi:MULTISPECIES: Gfo/Idh/MocA family protein [Dethiosulfovibrio]|uniref:Gfo/Idh/MocA family oxidoreductase n=3 Tax=Dethiosulfovibrio TaxID=47054 RepID=A0ABS9EMD1_9BACT|nr:MULTISPECIES: Gfo/Idh/MocA family oxidoreductase [Dethiosulfovibrio]MCF4142320.1 Gfo/Idh/MocA family oxidoreductase [Dethiosulfovibrio marinus]MCF4144628.1 Gfo/Idh/MocA family oxidoreductase [Dethiosulfovibrio acidaminovorans]
MKKISIGIIGSGFASHLHCKYMAQVAGCSIDMRAIADIDIEKARKVSDKYGFRSYYDDYRRILDDKEIDVVHICTPPFLHSSMVSEILRAGKHVICEKPLTGYFGKEESAFSVGDTVPKSVMFREVRKELAEIEETVKSSNRLFMYAENYIYSPNVLKAAEILRAKQSKILFMKGEESLKGSTSPVAGIWNKTGGGSLIRVGSHPIGGILWLKREQAKSRGESIGVESVICDTARMTPFLSDYERRHIDVTPEDVEDFASLMITFTDKTKALVIAGDVMLGGTKNYIEVYSNDVVLDCRITPSDNLSSYMLDEDGLEDVYISELLPSKVGWQNPFVAEGVLRGYVGQFQDFMECVSTGREPLSDFDLAKQVTEVIYGAYFSAEEGKSVQL